MRQKNYEIWSSSDRDETNKSFPENLVAFSKYARAAEVEEYLKSVQITNIEQQSKQEKLRKKYRYKRFKFCAQT